MVSISESSSEFMREKVKVWNKGRQESTKIKLFIQKGQDVSVNSSVNIYFPFLKEFDACRSEEEMYNCIGVSKAQILTVNRKLLQDGLELEFHSSRDDKNVLFYAEKAEFDSYIEYLSNLRDIEEIKPEVAMEVFNTKTITLHSNWRNGNLYVRLFTKDNNGVTFIRFEEIEEGHRGTELKFFKYPGNVENISKVMKKLKFHQ